MKELIKIQAEIKAPKKNKSQGVRYSFRSCDNILEAAKPILEKNGCYLIMDDDIIEVSGVRYVKSKATIYNSEGLSISSFGLAREPETLVGMSMPQITGACSSYARKSALSGLFSLDDSSNDPDSIGGKDSDQIILDQVKNAKTVEELNSIYAESKDFISDHNVLVSACKKQRDILCK